MVFYCRAITRISWNSILTRGTIVRTSGRNVWSTTGSSGAPTYLRVSGTSPGSSAGAPPSGEIWDYERPGLAGTNLPSPAGTAAGPRNKCRNTSGRTLSRGSPSRGQSQCPANCSRYILPRNKYLIKHELKWQHFLLFRENYGFKTSFWLQNIFWRKYIIICTTLAGAAIWPPLCRQACSLGQRKHQQCRLRLRPAHPARSWRRSRWVFSRLL